MINLILTILSTISMTLSLAIIALVHISVFLGFFLTLYWCIPTAWEKIEDLIDDYNDKRTMKKVKAMTDEELDDYREDHPLTTKYEPATWTEERKAERAYAKKHPILSFVRDALQTLARVLWYKVPEYPSDIKRYFRMWIQRATRGWAVSDAWGFDWYLARVIKEGCQWLKENKHGVPCGCMPNTLAVDMGEDNDEDMKKAIAKWDKVLDTIIKTFETAENIQENHWFYQETKNYSIKRAKEIRATNKKMKEEDPELFGKRGLYVMTKAECKEYEKGWELFREYFFNLWD